MSKHTEIGNRTVYTYIQNILEFQNKLNLHHEIEITTDVIDRLFRIKTISGDGNCLFNAISYALIEDESMSAELRKAVYEFYQGDEYKRIISGDIRNEFENKFIIMNESDDAEMDYIEDKNGTYYRHRININDYKSLREIKSYGYNFEKYEGPYKQMPHIENIQYDGVYGSNGDVLALCYLLNVNITVIVEQENGNFHRVYSYNRNDNVDSTIYLQLIDQNHYQVLLKRPNPESPSRSNRITRKLTSSNENKSSKSPRNTRSKSPRNTRSKSPRNTSINNEMLDYIKRAIAHYEPHLQTYKKAIVEYSNELKQIIEEKTDLDGQINLTKQLYNDIKKNNHYDNAEMLSQINAELESTRERLEIIKQKEDECKKNIAKQKNNELIIMKELEKLPKV